MSTAPNGSNSEVKRNRIVICEDKNADARNLQQIFESQDYRVIKMFSNGKELIEWYNDNSAEVDCIILDIVLPVLDGYATFWELKAIVPFPRIVIISIENSAAIIRKLIENGACDFVTKPIKREVILERVRKVMSRPLSS